MDLCSDVMEARLRGRGAETKMNQVAEYASSQGSPHRYRAGQGSDGYFYTEHAKSAGTARPGDPPGGNFLSRQKVTKERETLSVVLPHAKAALPWVPH